MLCKIVSQTIFFLWKIQNLSPFLLVGENVTCKKINSELNILFQVSLSLVALCAGQVQSTKNKNCCLLVSKGKSIKTKSGRVSISMKISVLLIDLKSILSLFVIFYVFISPLT